MTGSALRHQYFRMFLAQSPHIQVLKSFCENTEKSLPNLISENDASDSLRMKHLNQREYYEQLFFGDFCQNLDDKSNPIHINKGEINKNNYVEEIKRLNPDIVIAYGCSIIKSNLVEFFHNRFINVHLGLSPYYRGSGTNYFPFVNNEPVFCGVTFMHIDKGIDTGKIIHQMRANIQIDDNIYIIGNRLIKDMASETEKLVYHFDSLKDNHDFVFLNEPRRYYKNSDFTEESLYQMYDNFSQSMIGNYLLHQDELQKSYPLIQVSI